jgi:hypothetical protein
VTELTLVGGSIPTPIHNIPADVASFTFRIGDKRLNISIPPGMYSEASLCAKLEEVLNAAAEVAGSHNEFTVALFPNTSQLQITAVAGGHGHQLEAFGFLFGTGSYIDSIDKTTRTVTNIGSPALIFGCIPGVNLLDYNGVLVTPNSIDLGLLVNRVYLSLNYDTTQNMQTYTRGMGRSSPSAIIHYDDVREGRKYLNKETYTPLIVSKIAPVSRIQTIDVQFNTLFGGTANFGNREVSLVLEAVCYY